MLLRHWVTPATVLGVLIGCWGCGSQGPVQEFAHLELLPPEKQLSELSLGQYVVPIPTDLAELTNVKPRNRLQLDFTLMAELDHENVDFVANAYETSKGQVRNSVIRVCRHATLSDLEEPNLVTLKTDLLDAIEPFVGSNRIHKLVMPDVQKHEL